MTSSVVHSTLFVLLLIWNSKICLLWYINLKMFCPKADSRREPRHIIGSRIHIDHSQPQWGVKEGEKYTRPHFRITQFWEFLTSDWLLELCETLTVTNPWLYWPSRKFGICQTFISIFSLCKCGCVYLHIGQGSLTLYLVKHAEDERYKKRMYCMCFLAWTIKTITIILCYHVRGSFYAIVVKKKKKKKLLKTTEITDHRGQKPRVRLRITSRSSFLCAIPLPSSRGWFRHLWPFMPPIILSCFHDSSSSRVFNLDCVDVCFFFFPFSFRVCCRSFCETNIVFVSPSRTYECGVFFNHAF